jgi:hypothetical protein
MLRAQDGPTQRWRTHGILGSSGTPFIDSWLAMVTATQNAPPHWTIPPVTVTPRLEQEFCADSNPNYGA